VLNLPPPPAPLTPSASEPDDTDATDATDAYGVGVGVDGVDEEMAEVADEAEAPDNGDAAPIKRKKQGYKAIEIVEQIHQVQEWLTEGKRPNQIRALCAEHWGLQTRASESRMHEARKQMVLDINIYERKDLVAKMLQNLEKVLEQSLASNMGSNAIGAMKLQADLLQLIQRQN